MRIAIIGAGAMGSLFGAWLSTVADVALIDLNPAHVQAIGEQGLSVETVDGASRVFPLFATTDARAVEPGVDLALIFTKSHGTASAARAAAPLLAADGVVLSLQNGLGNLETIAAVLGRERTVAGVTSHGATLLGPGRVRHAGSGLTHIAGSVPDTDAPARIRQVFHAAGIEVRLADDLQSLIWGKLVINAGINALAAILRVPNGALGRRAACETIMAQAVAEAVAVSRGLGIRLPYDDPLQQVKAVCEATAPNRASMLQDIMRGARTEVGAINRALVNQGAALGIPTPCNRLLAEIIEALEATVGDRCS